MENTNTPNSAPKMPASPKKENVTDFPKAPAMKDTRKTGEVAKGTEYLRKHLNKSTQD